jgi:serine/threonine protein phosphatase PrpC
MMREYMQSDDRSLPLRQVQAFPGLAKDQPTGRIVTPHRWQRELPLRLEVGTAWDRGVRRSDSPNEDSLVALQGTCICNERLQPFGLFVVADGMGGHAYGKDASYLAVQTLIHFVLLGLAGRKQLDEEQLPRLLVEGVRRANLAVYQRSIDACAYMGTTLTAALIVDMQAYVVNVGDSRAYRYREREGLVQVTRDHSLVARLVETGVITQEEAYSHPERNQVYRGLGSKATVEVDCFKLSLQVDDRLLLCSDGLWEMVRDPQMMDILRQPGRRPAEISQRLVEAALEGGGLDNISAIVVHVAPVIA